MFRLKSRLAGRIKLSKPCISISVEFCNWVMVLKLASIISFSMAFTTFTYKNGTVIPIVIKVRMAR